MKKICRPLAAVALALVVGATGCGGDEEPVRPIGARRDSGTPATGRDSGTGRLTSPFGDGGFVFPGVDGGFNPTNPTGGDAGTATSPTDPTGGNDGGTVGGGGEIPCEVAEVLRTRCATCHSNPPTLGAPMPLVTLEDLRGTWNGEPMVQRVSARIHSESNPMPPNGDLSAEQMSALDNWIAAGAPAGPADQQCGGGFGEVDPDEIDCPNRVSFRAHASGNTDAPAPVPTGANEYICYYYRSPFTPNQVTNAWIPQITNTDHVHHWILYRLSAPPAGVTDGSAAPCSAAGGGTFVMGWAPGQGASKLPDDVGLQLSENQGEWLSLQIHYWNPQNVAGQVDASGVDFCVEDQPRENTAGTLAIVGAVPTIAPRSEGSAFGNCSNITQPINIIASGPHMHGAGTRFRTELIRANGQREMFVDVNPWVFDDQASVPHEPAIQVNPGDHIEVTCDYFNATNDEISFGEETEQEMCMNFAVVYPIQNAPRGLIFGRECGAPVPFSFF